MKHDEAVRKVRGFIACAVLGGHDWRPQRWECLSDTRDSNRVVRYTERCRRCLKEKLKLLTGAESFK